MDGWMGVKAFLRLITTTRSQHYDRILKWEIFDLLCKKSLGGWKDGCVGGSQNPFKDLLTEIKKRSLKTCLGQEKLILPLSLPPFGTALRPKKDFLVTQILYFIPLVFFF